MRRIVFVLTTAALTFCLAAAPALAGVGGHNPSTTTINWGGICVLAIVVIFVVGHLIVDHAVASNSNPLARLRLHVLNLLCLGAGVVLSLWLIYTGTFGLRVDTEAGQKVKAVEYCGSRYFSLDDPTAFPACIDGWLHPKTPPGSAHS